MTAVTTWLGTADPDECRAVAAMIEAGADGWRDRVAALPRCVLTPKTLASEPAVIAQHLRGVAVYLENRRAGLPLGDPEASAAYRAEREAVP
jgi:hypothetical protein